MRTKNIFLSLSTVLLVISSCSDPITAQKDDQKKVEEDHNTGGACTYKNYEGVAKIISVAPLPADHNDCFEGSQMIKFVFISPDSLSKVKFGSYFSDTAFLMISNEKQLSKEIIMGLKIKVNSEFKCIKEVIETGTCTPVLFTFPDDSLLLYKYCKLN